ncbi:MAG: SPOR domain-containing protein [Thermodesulfobacteriota bacterium]
MGEKTRLSTFRLLLLLILLAVSGVAAAYFLYFQPASLEPTRPETPARRPATQPLAVNPKLKGQIAAAELPKAQESKTGAAASSSEPVVAPVEKPAPAKADESKEPAAETAQPGAAATQSTAESKPAAAPEIKSEEIKPPAATTSEPPTAATSEPPATTAAPPTAPAPEEKPQEKKPTETAKTTPPKPQPKPAKEAIAGQPDFSNPARLWVVNILSTQDSNQVRQIMDALVKSPYRVYAYQTEIKGQNWYRLRVGFFNTRQEAEQVGRGLAKQLRLAQPWIVRPGPEEVAKHKH